jgi:hypothetical protein
MIKKFDGKMLEFVIERMKKMEEEVLKMDGR